MHWIVESPFPWYVSPRGELLAAALPLRIPKQAEKVPLKRLDQVLGAKKQVNQQKHTSTLHECKCHGIE